jgi:hypothetical protein
LGSGLVVLLLERNPALQPTEVRAIVIKTARDLGAPGCATCSAPA